MDCIITFKIFFKILGTLPLQAFLNEFKNRFTTALLQRGPFQNVHCRVAAHSMCTVCGEKTENKEEVARRLFDSLIVSVSVYLVLNLA